MELEEAFLGSYDAAAKESGWEEGLWEAKLWYQRARRAFGGGDIDGAVDALSRAP